MSRFYYRTGYKDTPIKNHLYITEDLVAKLECIDVAHDYSGDTITIKYFEQKFVFKSIKDLVDTLAKATEQKEK